jgi:hypothetical protein
VAAADPGGNTPTCGHNLLTSDHSGPTPVKYLDVNHPHLAAIDNLTHAIGSVCNDTSKLTLHASITSAKGPAIAPLHATDTSGANSCNAAISSAENEILKPSTILKSPPVKSAQRIIANDPDGADNIVLPVCNFEAQSSVEMHVSSDGAENKSKIGMDTLKSSLSSVSGGAKSIAVDLRDSPASPDEDQHDSDSSEATFFEGGELSMPTSPDCGSTPPDTQEVLPNMVESHESSDASSDGSTLVLKYEESSDQEDPSCGDKGELLDGGEVANEGEVANGGEVADGGEDDDDGGEEADGDEGSDGADGSDGGYESDGLEDSDGGEGVDGEVEPDVLEESDGVEDSDGGEEADGGEETDGGEDADDEEGVSGEEGGSESDASSCERGVTSEEAESSHDERTTARIFQMVQCLNSKFDGAEMTELEIQNYIEKCVDAIFLNLPILDELDDSELGRIFTIAHKLVEKTILGLALRYPGTAEAVLGGEENYFAVKTILRMIHSLPYFMSDFKEGVTALLEHRRKMCLLCTLSSEKFMRGKGFLEFLKAKAPVVANLHTCFYLFFDQIEDFEDCFALVPRGYGMILRAAAVVKSTKVLAHESITLY